MGKHSTTSMSVLVLAVCAVMGCGPGKFAPEFKPSVGDKRSLAYTQRAFTTVEVLGQSRVQASRADLAYDLEVAGIDASGVVELKCTITKSKFELDSDITNWAATQIVDLKRVMRILEGAAGETFTVYVSRDGTVRYVSASGLADRLMNKANIVDNAARGAMRFWIDQFMSENQLRGQFKGFFYVYTSTPMAVGESWVKNSEFGPAGSSLAGQSTLSLASLKNGTAAIHESVVMTEESQGQVSLGPGTDMRMNSSGSGHGAYEMEMESGWLTSFESNLNIKGTATITGQASLSLTVSIDISTVGTFQ